MMYLNVRVKSKEKGFTLVELLIVIAIIGILSSFALNSYLRYKDKSRITSHALPVADACANDIISYCIELSTTNPVTIDISSLDLANCKNQNILGYNLNITLTGNFTCNPGGTVSDGRVEAYLNEVPDYKAVCELNENSILCKVEQR